MPWKMDENGNLMKGDDGNPIAITESGEERSVDYAAMSRKLSEVNKESAGRKERIKALEAQLKPLEGIDDVAAFIEAARKNAEAVAAFDDKQRGAEEAVQARIKAATSPLEKQVAELEAERASIRDQFHASLISSKFGTSKYVAESLVSSGMAQELFGKHFSVDEQGHLIGKDSAGNIIFGENGPADFDTALSEIVKNSPHRAYVLKGSTATGSGASAGAGGNYTGAKTMRRSEFDKLDNVTKAARMREGWRLVDD